MTNIDEPKREEQRGVLLLKDFLVNLFRPDRDSVAPQDQKLWDAVVAGETPSYMMPGTLEGIRDFSRCRLSEAYPTRFRYAYCFLVLFFILIVKNLYNSCRTELSFFGANLNVQMVVAYVGFDTINLRTTFNHYRYVQSTGTLIRESRCIASSYSLNLTDRKSTATLRARVCINYE